MKKQFKGIEAKLNANPKVQKLKENPKAQKAIQHAPLAWQILIFFFFLVPWLAMLFKPSCYAMNRPDYFWPVREGTKDTDEFGVSNVSGKYCWIFFLGIFTHCAQLGVEKWEQRQAGQQLAEEVAEKNQKKIKMVKMVLFVARIIFFIWILFARFRHTGQVCSGDYKGYEQLKIGSNFDASMDYSYCLFAGWVLKIFCGIFLITLIVRGLIQLWYGTKGDDDDDDDDNYKPIKANNRKDIEKASPSRSNKFENASPGPFDRRASPDQNRRGTQNKKDSFKKNDNFEQPDYGLNESPAPRKSSAARTKDQSTALEKKIQDQMRQSLDNKSEGRKYSQNQRSSKKALQKQMNNFNKN